MEDKSISEKLREKYGFDFRPDAEYRIKKGTNGVTPPEDPVKVFDYETEKYFEDGRREPYSNDVFFYTKSDIPPSLSNLKTRDDHLAIHFAMLSAIWKINVETYYEELVADFLSKQEHKHTCLAEMQASKKALPLYLKYAKNFLERVQGYFTTTVQNYRATSTHPDAESRHIYCQERETIKHTLKFIQYQLREYSDGVFASFYENMLKLTEEGTKMPSNEDSVEEMIKLSMAKKRYYETAILILGTFPIDNTIQFLDDNNMKIFYDSLERAKYEFKFYNIERKTVYEEFLNEDEMRFVELHLSSFAAGQVIHDENIEMLQKHIELARKYADFGKQEENYVLKELIRLELILAEQKTKVLETLQTYLNKARSAENYTMTKWIEEVCEEYYPKTVEEAEPADSEDAREMYDK